MKKIRGVIGKCRERIGAESGAAAEVGREIGANKITSQAEALDVVIFERDGVERSGSVVAFILRRGECCVIGSRTRKPAEKFGAGRVADRSVGEFLADRIDDECSI